VKNAMPFELQPYLHGQLLNLRPLQAGDFTALYAVASDPLVWEQHPDADRYQEGVFRRFFRDAMSSGGALIATDNSTRAVIGSSRFNAYNEQAREIEIGWTFLARSHWGGIYNREMKDLMLRHAGRFVDRVLFVVGSSNRRSQKAVEKLGALRRGSREHANGRQDFIYALTVAHYLGDRDPCLVPPAIQAPLMVVRAPERK
jgi:RimJ/RimL family protein N-acetyltransferase